MRALKSIKDMVPEYLFVISLVCLFASTIANRTSIHDMSVYDITPSVLLLILAYILVVFSNKTNLKKVAIYSSIYLTSLSELPSLKYVLIFGTGDALVFPEATAFIVQHGIIGLQYAYSDFPGMMIAHAVLSIVTGISSMEVLKYLIPSAYGLFPIIVYMISKHVYQSKNLQVYSVLSSVILVSLYLFQPYNYFIAPVSLAMLIGFLDLTVLISRMSSSKETGRGLTAIFLMITIAIVITHPYTSLLLIIFLTITSIVLSLITTRPQLRFQARKSTNQFMMATFFTLTITLLYWTFIGSWILDSLVNILYKYVLLPTHEVILPSKYFKINLSSFLLINIGKLESGILSLIGLIIFYRNKNLRKNLNDVLTLYVCVFLLLVGGFLFILGYQIVKTAELSLRIVAWSFMICPILSSLTLSQLDIKFRSLLQQKLVMGSIVFIILLFSLFEFFPSETRTPEVPNIANSIYLYNVVNFIDIYRVNESRIITDVIIRTVILGYTNQETYKRILPEFIFNDLIKMNFSSSYSINALIVLHKPGKASSTYNVNKTAMTADIIGKEVRDSHADVIFSNGESYVLRMLHP